MKKNIEQVLIQNTTSKQESIKQSKESRAQPHGRLSSPEREPSAVMFEPIDTKVIKKGEKGT